MIWQTDYKVFTPYIIAIRIKKCIFAAKYVIKYILWHNKKMYLRKL